METRLKIPQGDFHVRRFPLRKRELLRAWDAADEYLLQECSLLVPVKQPVLVVNDSFGALTVALNEHPLQSWSDSFLSQQATRFNYHENRLDPESVSMVNSLDLPATPFQAVLFKIPKTLALMEYQLLRLRPLLSEQTVLLFGGMVKNMPASVWKLLEKIIGPVETGLARKKARLLKARLDPHLKPPPNPYPTVYQLEQTTDRISNHANVFSREKLDIGTRFFLQHLPRIENPQVIADLGCGNGVLGLMTAKANPQVSVHFIDESYMAIASARENFQRLCPGRNAGFHIADGLSDFTVDVLDRVFCNPPFHQHSVVGDHIATSMFAGAASALKPGGELWVIGNRHLNYHYKLKRWFNRIELVASNKKFVVLKAL